MSLDSLIIYCFGIFVMLLYVVIFKVKNKKIEIDHITCLFFGIFYYIYLPIYTHSSSYTYTFSNVAQKKAFSSISNPAFSEMLLTTLGIIVAIILADLMSKNKKYSPSLLGTPNIGVMKLSLLLLSLFILPAFIDMIPVFFNHYDTSLWVRGSRGPFLSYIVILVAMSSMYLIRKGQLDLFNIFTIFAFSFSLINVFSGNRGFFISFIISIIIVASQLRGGIKIRNLLLIALVGIIFSGLVGQIRSGSSASLDWLSLMQLSMYHLNAEGGNVATSMYIYISNYDANYFEFPHSFLSQFISIIPSFIFPAKFDYLILDPRVTYFLSSSHFYVILLVNFGIIGAIFFMYLFTYVLNVIKYKYKAMGIYPALCCLIPFMFFRDFDLTVVKFMFEFTFLYALIIILTGNTISKIYKIKS